MELSQAKRVLVFGGTFDPPHVAHLVLPMLAMEAVGAQVVAYVPAARSPHKPDAAPTPAEHRLAMLKLALGERPWATILTDELDRADADGPSYTVDTLEALRKRLPQRVELRLLIGADQLRAFDRWRNPQRIIELAEPAVMLRPPDTRQRLLSELPAGFDREAWSPRIVELPLLDVSATEIRGRIAAARPVAGFVCDAVERYIAEHGLYR